MDQNCRCRVPTFNQEQNLVVSFLYSRLVDVIKLFLQEIWKNQFQRIVLLKIALFSHFEQVQTLEQTFFHFLTLGKSRFPPKKVLQHQLLKIEFARGWRRLTDNKCSMSHPPTDRPTGRAFKTRPRTFLRLIYTTLDCSRVIALTFWSSFQCDQIARFIAHWAAF